MSDISKLLLYAERLVKEGESASAIELAITALKAANETMNSDNNDIPVGE